MIYYIHENTTNTNNPYPKFSNEDYKTIDSKLKELIDQWNNGKLKKYIESKGKYTSTDIKPFKLIHKLRDKSTSSIVYRIIPASVPDDYDEFTTWLVDDISHELYSKIKSCANGKTRVEPSEPDEKDEDDNYNHFSLYIFCA